MPSNQWVDKQKVAYPYTGTIHEKKKWTTVHATIWLNLKNIILGESHQIQKTTFYMKWSEEASLYREQLAGCLGVVGRGRAGRWGWLQMGTRGRWEVTDTLSDEIVGLAVQLWQGTNKRWNAHLKQMDFTVCKLHLNETFEKCNCPKETWQSKAEIVRMDKKADSSCILPTEKHFNFWGMHGLKETGWAKTHRPWGTAGIRERGACFNT